MPTRVWDVPVFEFFATYPHGLDGDATYQSGQKCVGEVTDIDSFDKLVPAPWHHVEINRDEEGQEKEVRVVDSRTGDYHRSILPFAEQLIAELDERTAQLFSPEERAFPPGFSPGEEKEGEFQRAFVLYDHEGRRLLPPIRHAGTLDTYEAYLAKGDGFSVWYEVEDFVGVACTRTGDMWWVTEDVKAQVLEAAKNRPDTCARGEGNDEAGGGDKGMKGRDKEEEAA